MSDTSAVLELAADRRELVDRLKLLLVDRLGLTIPVRWITDDQPLFGRGLELDSIDSIELAMALEEEFGIVVPDEDLGIFGSLNAVADYVSAAQVR